MFLCTSKVHSDREIPCKVMRALKEEESSSRMEGRGGKEGQGPVTRF